MQKCWDTDPSKRPTIRQLLDLSNNKLKEIYENERSNSNNNDASLIN